MRTGHTVLNLIACAAALTMASTPALAQTAQATKLSGVTGAGSGTWSRTIIDIGEPNGPVTSPYGIMKVTGGTVLTPWTAGQNADTLGTHFRNALNANGVLTGGGYSARPTTPSGATKLFRPKTTRQTGSFSIDDMGTLPPGITATADAFTVEDAPATSTPGLILLVSTLSLLAWRESRRRRRKA